MENIEVNTAAQIADYASTLNTVNFQMAELARIKEQLEGKLTTLLQHPSDGSKTYSCDKFKVTITSGWIYTLDKEEFGIIKNSLPEWLNPVKERVSLEVNKQKIRNAEKYGSSEDLRVLEKFISKKPSKIHVKIGANI